MTAVDKFGKVAVLLGGWSSERSVSLQSGDAVMSALEASGVDAHAIDVDRDICTVLTQGNYDRVFNILHGTAGEDGAVQGMLEVMGIPYTGSGVKASALAMDKLQTKRIWRSGGLPTPVYLKLTADTDWSSAVKSLGLPMIVKPVAEGSSIGMTKVTTAEALQPAWQAASEFGDVFAEQWVVGEEYTVAVLQNEALPAIRLETPHDFYDFSAKYEAGDTQYHCPCGLSEEDEGMLQKTALAAFNMLGASGWGRVDLMRDQQGKFWLIELNTIPGMTSHSLVPKSAKVAGIKFNDLVLRILETSLK